MTEAVFRFWIEFGGTAVMPWHMEDRVITEAVVTLWCMQNAAFPGALKNARCRILPVTHVDHQALKAGAALLLIDLAESVEQLFEFGAVSDLHLQNPGIVIGALVDGFRRVFEALVDGDDFTGQRCVQIRGRLDGLDDPELFFQCQLTADFLLAHAAQIEAALEQTDKLAQYSQRMVTRCLALKPAPLPRIPLGF